MPFWRNNESSPNSSYKSGLRVFFLDNRSSRGDFRSKYDSVEKSHRLSSQQSVSAGVPIQICTESSFTVVDSPDESSTDPYAGDTVICHHSQDAKRSVQTLDIFESPPETPFDLLGALPTIPEHDFYRLPSPASPPELELQIPSIVTAENAAAAKLSLEIIFSRLLSKDSAFRSNFQTHENLSFNGIVKYQLRHLRVLKTRKFIEYTSSKFIGSYEKIRVLGKGSFGCVQLVQKQDDPPGMHVESDVEVLNEGMGTLPINSRPFKSKVFAMKIIRKSEMLRKCQEGHLRAERDCLVAAEKSRWIVPLIESFQDRENLYLVMEYMVGGDFLNILLRWDLLSEETARFYMAEMILCIEEVHNMGWIHRDVKPDNFLVSSSGHLKISDFGLAFDGHWSHHQRYFTETRHDMVSHLGIQIDGDVEDIETARNSKDGKARPTETNRPAGHLLIDKLEPGYNRRLAKTIVGTSQYMAPEIVAGEAYDGRCDYWSLGIILYECLYGQTPFHADSREETKQLILNWDSNLRFPIFQRYQHMGCRPSMLLPPLSSQAVDLMKGIIIHKDLRLGGRKYREYEAKLQRLNGKRTVQLYPQTNFVFEGDSADIKKHPWFHDFPWERVHAIRPPFVPQISNNQSIAKYFQDEREILDSTGRFTVPANVDDYFISDQGRRRVNPPKRPRDKILRDPKAGEVALRIRKQKAFPAYTYRRPN